MTSIGAAGQKPKPIATQQADAAKPQSGIAAAAGAAAAKGAGSISSVVNSLTDKFDSAKIGSDIGKSQPKGIMAGGCCLPPPGGKFPGGVIDFDLKGWQLKNEASQAKDKFNKTADKSESVFSEGGKQITDKEQRHVNSAGRDWKIADKKVDLHEAQEAHKKARTEARADGNISDADQKRLNDGQAKIDKLQGELNGLVAADKKADQSDKWKDMLDNIKPTPKPFPGGKLPDIGPGGKFPDIGPGGKLPDIGPGGKFPGIGPGDKFPGIDDWKPKPGDLKLPEGRPFPCFDFPLPNLKPLPFPFPTLPTFPKLPTFDFKPFLLESFKLW